MMIKKIREIPNEVKDWKWNPQNMKDEEKKEKYRQDPIKTSELLYQIIKSLDALLDNIETGIVSMFSAVCLTKDMWDATNYARLWPEQEHDIIDHLLQDALAHIAETHYMLESMWAWDSMGKSAFRSVTNELKYALLALRKALLEVEVYIYTQTTGGKKQDGDEKCRVE